jgi:hypothetical protein
MGDLGRRLAGVLAAFVFVASALAVIVFVAGLASGDVTARRVIAALLSAAAMYAIGRYVPVERLLGGYAALLYAFLFIPILVVVIYAFNEGPRSTTSRSRRRSVARCGSRPPARRCRRFSARRPPWP